MPVSKRNASVWPKILLGIIGLGAGVWILIASLGASATREWEAFAASLRAKGQPLTFAEIEARRAVIPEDQNSARVLENLFAVHDPLAKRINLLDQGLQSFFTGISKGKLEEARLLVQENQPLLEKLDALRDKPSGRFSIQYNQKNPLETLLPHLTKLRAASKLVRLQSATRLVAGDSQGVVRDFELDCRLASAIGDEPMLISRMVQIAVQAQAIQIAENLLRTSAVDDETLRQMASELESMRRGGTMQWALLGERAFFVETCEALADGRMAAASVSSFVDGENRGPFPCQRLPAFLVRSNELRGARMHTSLIEASDPTALLAAAKQIEQEVQDLSWTQGLVKILMPGFTRSIMLMTKITAHLDCAIAALSAERFRLGEGKLPSTLEELVPKYLAAVPVDPFDGKPLRLAKTAEGIVIYSVDENGVDDGGQVALPPQDKKLKRAPDVGFRLNDVDHRGVLLVDDPPIHDD